MDLDPVLHHPARLKICMLLAASATTTFNTLAKDAALTAGNLQSHLKALEAAGYVDATRSFVDLKPRMRYALTDAGAAALRRYCDQLAEVVRGIEALDRAKG